MQAVAARAVAGGLADPQAGPLPSSLALGPTPLFNARNVRASRML